MCERNIQLERVLEMVALAAMRTTEQRDAQNIYLLSLSL